MANKSEEPVSSEGMFLGGGSRGKWGTVAVLDVCRPANDAIVRLVLQLMVYQQDTQMWLFSKTEITSTHDDDQSRLKSGFFTDDYLVIQIRLIRTPDG